MNSRHAFVIVAAFSLGTAETTSSQATNPPYLASFPSADRVKQAMKVSDPRETAVRQIGALYQLEQIIRQLSGSREFRGFLPDEARVIGEYQVASYNIAQAIDKAYPGRYNTGVTVSDYTPYRFMRTDRRFGIDGIETFKTFLTPAVQDQFTQSVGGDIARHEARQKADQEAIASIGTSTQPKSKLAEEQAGIRRCVESGRSESQCMMEGLGKSADNMLGGMLSSLNPKPASGLRISGDYTSAGVRLSFLPEQVTVSCGDIVPSGYEYSIQPQGTEAIVTIPIQPKPLVLSVRSDGRLSGPALIDLTGQVQVGTQYGTRTWNDGHTEPISRPVYETQTHRCSAQTFAARAPDPITAKLTQAATSPTGLFSAMLGGMDQNQELPVPAGLRLVGEWGSESAVDLEFRPEGVVVGCRDATILRPYAIQVAPAGISINVQNGASPFTVTLAGDGRLSGSGSFRVDGRVVTGTTGNGGITYAPRSATCTLGPLSPAPSQ